MSGNRRCIGGEVGLGENFRSRFAFGGCRRHRVTDANWTGWGHLALVKGDARLAPLRLAGQTGDPFRGRPAPESVQAVAIPRCSAREDNIDQTSRAMIDRSGPYGLELKNEK